MFKKIKLPDAFTIFSSNFPIIITLYPIIFILADFAEFAELAEFAKITKKFTEATKSMMTSSKVKTDY